MRELHVLNLGAGVQSTALYLMFMRGDLKPQIDCAIFADTQDEPKAVYRHLEWLQSLNGPPIMVRSKGKLSDNLMRGEYATGQRFASIPAYTLRPNGTEGKTRRQCSMEYKIVVIEKTIRRELCGAAPGRTPRDFIVHQYIGISLDEAGRARRIKDAPRPKYLTVGFPERLVFGAPDAPDLPPLAFALRDARRALRLSVREFARDRLEISEDALRDIEAGRTRTPQRETLRRILDWARRRGYASRGGFGGYPV